MAMTEIRIEGLRYSEGIYEQLSDIKGLLEQRINLNEYTGNVRPISLPLTTVMRTCMLVGLCDNKDRNIEEMKSVELAKNRQPLQASFFTKLKLKRTLSVLIKLRYYGKGLDLNDSVIMSKLIGYEMLRGRKLLMQEGGLEDWLRFIPSKDGKQSVTIPVLDLCIGKFDNEQDAKLDINNRSISNAQIIIAGATGSGKSNLLAVLLNQIRTASSDSQHPVNFLLFDYKGEFSDPANSAWLEKFDTNSNAILNPMEKSLPFTPFKDFTGKPINELNLYSTSMSKALISIAKAKISANMDYRLSEAIINAYKAKNMKPITFKEMLDNYIQLLPEKKQDTTDSVISTLGQLVRNNPFEEEDRIDLIKDCYIINLGKYEKQGLMAKAIVYFVISKLNNIYEQLPRQEKNDERVEIRHFTIIDEAHYMLGFENKPLNSLINVGRDKGLSIILATQSMDCYKTKDFNYYTNAQYPLIMRQQTQNDAILKDLFGVSGSSLQELKQALSSLQKGEVIMKDANAMEFGIGKHWKKIKVTHLI